MHTIMEIPSSSRIILVHDSYIERAVNYLIKVEKEGQYERLTSMSFFYYAISAVSMILFSINRFW
jgi:hypothetical protein